MHTATPIQMTYYGFVNVYLVPKLLASREGTGLSERFLRVTCWTEMP